MSKETKPTNDEFLEYYELKVRFEKDEAKFKRYLELKPKFDKGEKKWVQNQNI